MRFGVKKKPVAFSIAKRRIGALATAAIYIGTHSHRMMVLGVTPLLHADMYSCARIILGSVRGRVPLARRYWRVSLHPTLRFACAGLLRARASCTPQSRAWMRR